MNIGTSLYHLNTNARTFSPNSTARVNSGGGNPFIDALLSKTSAGRDTFIQSGQADAKTGSKFLIDNLGSGFFIMAAVDSELEDGFRAAL